MHALFDCPSQPLLTIRRCVLAGSIVFSGAHAHVAPVSGQRSSPRLAAARPASGLQERARNNFPDRSCPRRGAARGPLHAGSVGAESFRRRQAFSLQIGKLFRSRSSSCYRTTCLAESSIKPVNPTRSRAHQYVNRGRVFALGRLPYVKARGQCGSPVSAGRPQGRAGRAA